MYLTKIINQLKSIKMKNLLAILLLALVITSCNKEEEEVIPTTTNNKITINKGLEDEEIIDNLVIEWITYDTIHIPLDPYINGPELIVPPDSIVYNMWIQFKKSKYFFIDLIIKSDSMLNIDYITSNHGFLSDDSVSIIASLEIDRDIDDTTWGDNWESQNVSDDPQDIVINTDLSIDDGNPSITYGDLSFKGSILKEFPTTKTFNIHIER